MQFLSSPPTGSRCGFPTSNPGRSLTSPPPASTPCPRLQGSSRRTAHTRRPGLHRPGIGIRIPAGRPKRPGPRCRHPHAQRPDPLALRPGRTQVRAAQQPLAHPAAHHRQPRQDRRYRPRRPGPHPFRARLHQIKFAEIASVTSEGTPLMRSATVAMDLAWASTPGVGPESRRRTRNQRGRGHHRPLPPSRSRRFPLTKALLQDLQRHAPAAGGSVYSSRRMPPSAEPTPDDAPQGGPAGIAKRTRQRERDNELRRSGQSASAVEKFRRGRSGAGHSAPTGTSSASGTCTSATTLIAVTGRPAAFFTSR